MKKLIALFLLASVLIGCATVSEPTDKSARLANDEGAVIFSTADDGSTTDYSDMTRRSVRAVLSLGLSELENTDDLQIHFASFDPAAKSAGRDFYVVHSYRTQEDATTRKWHVLRLKAGSYILTNLTYQQPAGFNRLRFNTDAYQFDVKAGESLYLGDIALACGNTVVETDSGQRVEAWMPQMKGIAWNTDEANRKLSAYPNYPTPLRSAELKTSAFREGR